MMSEVNRLSPEVRNFLDVLDDLDGLYVCPKEPTGRRLGPVVGYTATYRRRSDGHTRQYVGDIYLNCAMAEQHPYIYDAWVLRIAGQLASLRPTVFMGLPTGGVSVATALARLGGRVIYPDLEVTALKTPTSRAQSKLVWGRHKLNIRPRDRVVIVEDVINNLSTGQQALELVREVGATPVAFAGLFCYRPIGSFEGIPVISVEVGKVPQYTQDDPQVAADISSGNVTWKPKDIWAELIENMKKVRRSNYRSL
jgi:adenine/guanine phosphoribosyltransferase-like PRPP-binding protein